jgi:hypothetical protein
MTTTTPETNPAELPSGGGADEPIVARAGRYYRNTRYVVSLGLVLVGAWFAYDGWVRYPQERAMHQQNPKTGVPHTDTDIRLQKTLGSLLPPAGLLFLGWTLYRSRGAYRLQRDVLSVPGHPDVPLDAIRAMDKSKWDRKGIAYVEYDLSPGAPGAGGAPAALDYRSPGGRITLDDFVYDRPPTDAIVGRIEAHLAHGAEATIPQDQQPAA